MWTAAHLPSGNWTPTRPSCHCVWVWWNVVLLYVNCVFGFTGIGFWKDQNLAMTRPWWLKRDDPNTDIKSSQKFNDAMFWPTRPRSKVVFLSFPAQMCCYSSSFSPCLTTFVNPVISCLDPVHSRSTEEVTTTTQKCNSAFNVTVAKSPSPLGTLMDSAICPLHLCKMWLHKQAIWYSNYYIWLVI